VFAFAAPDSAPRAGVTNAPLVFAPADTRHYLSCAGVAAVAVERQITGVLVPPVVSPLAYGQPLSAAVLSGGTATNIYGVAVPGVFSFSSPSLVPAPGSTNAALAFTPADAADYFPSTALGAVAVGRGVPVLALAPSATGLTYGQPLSSSRLSGGVATNGLGGLVLGTFRFAAPDTVPPAGAAGAPLTFIPADPDTYTTAGGSVTVAVARQTPGIAVAPLASGLEVGQALSASRLSGGLATNAAGAAVPGVFAFNSPAAIPAAGTTVVPVTFTPADADNYNSAGTSAAVRAIGFSAVVAWGDDAGGQTEVPAGLPKVVSLAGGGMASYAVGADGAVYAWGDNSYGQTEVPAGLGVVKSVAGGYLHATALRADGTVSGWGNNFIGQLNVPAGLSGIRALAGGYFHTVALASNGTVTAWGYNGNGQTQPPAGLGGVIAVAAGLTFLYGLFVMLLWNWIMPDIFSLPRIDYWHAWGVVLLSHILFKSWGGRHWRPRR
jgi:hypothetical protein